MEKNLKSINNVSKKGVDVKGRNTGFLIITKSRQTERLKEMLSREGVSYEVYDNKKIKFLSELAKLSPQETKEIQETEEILNSLSKFRIKYSKGHVLSKRTKKISNKVS